MTVSTPASLGQLRHTMLTELGVRLLTDVAGERGMELVIGPDCPVFSVVQVSGLCEVAKVQCR